MFDLSIVDCTSTLLIAINEHRNEHHRKKQADLFNRSIISSSVIYNNVAN